MATLRELLGDLAVASHELVQAPQPPYDRSVIATFEAWYARTERWLRLAIDTGIAFHASPDDAPDELIGLFAAAFEGAYALEGLVDSVEARFDYIGYEEGYLYGGIDWEQLCIARSALDFAFDLLENHEEVQAQLDLARIDDKLARWGHELFEPLSPPAGIPDHHWWWHRERPPDEDQSA